MSADRAVVTLLYRSILRWNKQLASVPVDLRAAHVEEVCPGFRKQHNGNFGSIRNLAQWGFRQEAIGTTDPLTVRPFSTPKSTEVRCMCRYLTVCFRVKV